ncbi:hypothetical protein C8R47DRAFT_589283 [Mycena vitilis]|nr:hypothetical protein C8R47DRAFT_589283 [Mycena vitilis]
MKILGFFPILNYPLTRPYPWSSFTPLVALLSCVVLACLTVLNVATQGYESITILESNFSNGTSQWRPSFGKGPTTCQPHQVLPGDEIRSNVSLLRYSIGSIERWHTVDKFPSLVDVTGEGFLYSGGKLQDLCPGSLSQWTLTVELDARARTVLGTIQVPCALDPKYTNSLQLLGRHTSDALTIKFGSGFPSNDIPLWPRMDMALSGLAGDLLVAVLSTPGIDHLRAWGWIYCPAFETPDRNLQFGHDPEDESKCAEQPANLYISSIDTLYANNTLVSSKNATSPALQQGIANYFQLLSAAGQGDMGIWTTGNLLLSQTMLNATITANDPVSALVAASPNLAWLGGNVTGVNTSAASHLRATGFQDVDESAFSLPVPQNQTTPAVFQLSYLCSGRTLKPMSSFLISVFVADASMFTVFWSILMLGAAMLARKRDSVANARHRCEDDCASTEMNHNSVVSDTSKAPEAQSLWESSTV